MSSGMEPKPGEISGINELSEAFADPKITPHPDQIAAHLANERTFLAWSFTALFIMSGGVALARTLIALNTSPLTTGAVGFSTIFYPTTMGLLFLGAGLVIMILASCRYMSVQEQICERRYRPSSTWVLVYLTIILALSGVLAVLLLQLRGTF